MQSMTSLDLTKSHAGSCVHTKTLGSFSIRRPDVVKTSCHSYKVPQFAN